MGVRALLANIVLFAQFCTFFPADLEKKRDCSQSMPLFSQVYECDRMLRSYATLIPINTFFGCLGMQRFICSVKSAEMPVFFSTPLHPYPFRAAVVKFLFSFSSRARRKEILSTLD